MEPYKRRPINNQMQNNSRPQSIAFISGGEETPAIQGEVRFYPFKSGTKVWVEITGLPLTQTMDGIEYPAGMFAFHIHEGGSCYYGTSDDPFPETGGHYNPDELPHPYHTGDMPPVLANNGYAYMVFYTDRFLPTEIIGKTVVLHAHPDDFHSQPSGMSGKKIACGQIVPIKR